VWRSLHHGDGVGTVYRPRFHRHANHEMWVPFEKKKMKMCVGESGLEG
jgi:hypothetical protein